MERCDDFIYLQIAIVIKSGGEISALRGYVNNCVQQLASTFLKENFLIRESRLFFIKVGKKRVQDFYFMKEVGMETKIVFPELGAYL
jgi:hypothetical protein